MIRSVVSMRAKPGRTEELMRVLERAGVHTVASDQAGFLGVEVATAVDDPDEIVILESWASLPLYERWRDSPVSSGLLGQVADLVTVSPVRHVYHVVDAVR